MGSGCGLIFCIPCLSPPKGQPYSESPIPSVLEDHIKLRGKGMQTAEDHASFVTIPHTATIASSSIQFRNLRSLPNCGVIVVVTNHESCRAPKKAEPFRWTRTALQLVRTDTSFPVEDLAWLCVRAVGMLDGKPCSLLLPQKDLADG